MSDFKTRLVAERDELKERTEKLAAFVVTDAFLNVDVVQGVLLQAQLGTMRTYLQNTGNQVKTSWRILVNIVFLYSTHTPALVLQRPAFYLSTI